MAAKKARDAIIDRKKILGGGGLPGKLMDCTTKNREESELFLVEGDSRRRLGGERPRSHLPGRAAAAGQSAQRREGATREAIEERGDRRA